VKQKDAIKTMSALLTLEINGIIMEVFNGRRKNI
jgi:hypothetical protein